MIQDMYMNSNFAEEFANIIIKEFMGDVKMKTIDQNLKSDEIP